MSIRKLLVLLLLLGLTTTACSKQVKEEEPVVDQSAALYQEALERLQSLMQQLPLQYFEVDKYDLSPGAQSILKEMAELLKRPLVDIELTFLGHTDSSGIDAKNWELSADRASSARRYLIRQGVAGSRLNIVGYASTRPVADNDTVEGKQRNRRVEARIQDTEKKKSSRRSR